jgi:hypothetical protein
MKSASYLLGYEWAKKDFELLGYESTLDTYMSYMEDPIFEYYHPDIQDEIKGYCDAFEEIYDRDS